MYNTEPYTVTPLQATWGVESYPQSTATTDQTGLATCKSGSSGTTTIEAWVQLSPAVCEVIDSAGRPGCGNIGGSARLTCQQPELPSFPARNDPHDPRRCLLRWTLLKPR